MKKTGATHWLAMTCCVSVAGCGVDDMPNDVPSGGSLLMSTQSPPNVEDPCCGPNVDYVAYSVSCDTGNDDGPIAEGELEVVDVNVGLVHDDDAPSWQGFVDGLPSGFCTVRLSAIAFSGEHYCGGTTEVHIEEGQVADSIIPLTCTLGWGPRPDLTKEETQACIDAGAACF